MRYTGTMKTGQKQKCTYEIKALKPAEFKQKASLTYLEDSNKTTIYSDEQKIIINDYALSFNYLISNYSGTKISPNEEFLLGFSLANINENKDLSITKFTMAIPADMKIIKKSSALEREENTITWLGIIEKESSKNFSLTLKAEKAGNYKISYSYRYEIDTTTREEHGIISINTSKPDIEIKFSKENLITGKNNLWIDIFNPADKPIENLKVTISSDLDIEIDKVYTSFKPGETISILNKEINFPDEEKTYNISVTVSYEIYSQVFTKQITKTVYVTPSSKPEPEINTTETTETPAEEPSEEQPAEQQEELPSPQKDIIKKISILAFMLLLIIFVAKEVLKKKYNKHN